MAPHANCPQVSQAYIHIPSDCARVFSQPPNSHAGVCQRRGSYARDVSHTHAGTHLSTRAGPSTGTDTTDAVSKAAA
eukprot:1489051-Rhodomonas_salina.9